MEIASLVLARRADDRLGRLPPLPPSPGRRRSGGEHEGGAALRTRKSAQKVGAIIVVAGVAVVAFVAGRLSTTSWPIVADACVEYGKVRAEFAKAEREFEAKDRRGLVHAAVYRDFERPDAYLARVSTAATHAAYVESRAECARQLQLAAKAWHEANKK